ncbi:MAG: adenosine kinase [Bacteroidia bacterium]|nr:adenosine kinase [Bacteroidia bacterium]
MEIKVLGIGNALVDIMTRLESDSFLLQHNLPKGSMQLVNIELSEKVLRAADKFEKSISSGGSAANTIHGLSNIGCSAGYIGKIGNDKLGEIFRNDMERNNIETRLLLSDTNTGRAIVFVSPDTERTFATYLGAAVELNADDLKPEFFNGYAYLHIEGYLVINHDFVLKAVSLAKENGLKVSLDFASFNVVKDNLDFLRHLAKNYIDILFANEEEAKAFTGKGPEEAISEISEYCSIAIVKIGANGSLIKAGNDIYKIDAIKANPVDTTGAGDLYASGFLYGLTRKMPLDKCGRIGALLAGKVIEVTGSKISEDIWDNINKDIRSI